MVANLQRLFHVESLEKTAQDDFQKLASAVYLQVSTISQALIFVTRSRSWSFVERPGFLLVFAFLVAQLVSDPIPAPRLTAHAVFPRLVSFTFLWCLQIATLIAVYANWAFAAIKGIGWGWAGVIWLYNIVFYFPLDIIKFLIRYALSGRAWNLVLEQRVRTIVDFRRSVFWLSNARAYPCFVALQTNVCNHLSCWCTRSDCVHEQEEFWHGRKGAQVGACAEDSPWAPAARGIHLREQDDIQ
jgi:hypothetical protein